jgi:dTDP-4-dehydrorhamnose 3,5-epimerase
MGQQLIVADTSLQGVKLVSSTSYEDERGAFSRWFCLQTLTPELEGQSIRQINHSVNLRAGTVRGMHFQKGPAAEFKLVRCIRGRVQDVVLDVRAQSATFGSYFSCELSEANQQMLLIPPGCAHGFQALEDNSQLLYLHTQDYHPALEAGVRVDDPQFNIQWPLPIQYLSERDQSFAPFSAQQGQ